MKVKLRTKADGKLQVLEGVLRVELFAQAPNFVPSIQILMHSAIAIDAETVQIGTESQGVDPE